VASDQNATATGTLNTARRDSTNPWMEVILAGGRPVSQSYGRSRHIPPSPMRYAHQDALDSQFFPSRRIDLAAGAGGAVQVSLHDRLEVRIADHCCGRLSKRPRTATGGVADSRLNLGDGESAEDLKLRSPLIFG
jgi:hypothetical protein